MNIACCRLRARANGFTGASQVDLATERIVAAVIESRRSAWGESLRALVLYGSALRGDYIPNCSDIDFRLIRSLW